MIAKLQKSKFLNRVEGKRKISTESQKKKFSKLKATQNKKFKLKATHKKKFKPVPKQKKKFPLQKTKWETRKSNLIILIRESRSVLRYGYIVSPATKLAPRV